MEILEEKVENNKHLEKNKKDCLNYLNFTDIKQFGIPKNISPVMAYHNIQGLIALGTMDGKIKM